MAVPTREADVTLTALRPKKAQLRSRVTHIYVIPDPNEIANLCTLGFVKVTAPKICLKLNKNTIYLGKYIGKGYEYDALNVSLKNSFLSPTCVFSFFSHEHSGSIFLIFVYLSYQVMLFLHLSISSRLHEL